MGEQTEDGSAFQVLDVVFPLLEQQKQLPPPETETWIAIVSGLDMGSSQCDLQSDFKLQTLADWLAGELGTTEVYLKSSHIIDPRVYKKNFSINHCWKCSCEAYTRG